MESVAFPVLVFTAPRDLPEERLRTLQATLSLDEERRAASIRIERVRRRFIAARGTLRAVLAREVGAPAGSLRFVAGPLGKPSLDFPRVDPPIELNLSHSEDLFIVAVARGHAVGVDVEVIRPDVDVAGLAARFFSPGERDRLLALDPADHRRAFFTCWTRKEAYIKARGEGLAIALDRFDVAFGPGEPPALLADRADPGAPGEWTILDLPLFPNASAAIAVRTGADFVPRIRVAGAQGF